MVESTLTPFVAADGITLAVQDWPLEAGRLPRAWVLVVHGLGEHAGRYEEMATYLNEWGYAVRGYDHYGHGESDGPRGGLTSDQRLVDDLADIVEHTRGQMPPGTPLILLGHSLGGLVAADAVRQGRVRVDALVLSSPALDAGLNPFQKLLLAVLPALFPNLRVHNGLDPKWISHDADVVQAYRWDRRVHNRISARLGQYIALAGPKVLQSAAAWTLPTLLLYAGSDRLVSPRGSVEFVQRAPSQWVQSQAYPEFYHEIFNEVAREEVYARLRSWLDEITASPAGES